MAAEFAQLTDKIEKRFMHLVKRLKAAYDICSGSDALTQTERDHIHFYLAVRSIVVQADQRRRARQRPDERQGAGDDRRGPEATAWKKSSNWARTAASADRHLRRRLPGQNREDQAAQHQNQAPAAAPG
jgi:hypothetical protein